MTLSPGTQLGTYRIVAPIGAGGMGEVFRAKDAKLGREVAIKVLPPGFAEDPNRLRRFQQEAQTLAALSHPNVVQVFAAGEHQGRPYLVMELLEGETLRQCLEKGRLPWRKAAELAAAIADGLAAAHAKGIVHRDLKPENLVLTEHGIKILDFGLAKVRPATLGEATTVDTTPPGTLDGALLGTIGYMAPEQVHGQPTDARSDIFALGCVLYEMVTGQRAFARASTVDTMAAILRDPVPPAGLSGSGGSPELDRILAHCLEKAPGDRFQSAKDLGFDLRSLLLATPAGASGPSPVPGPRRFLLPAVILLALLLAAGILGRFPWKPAALPYDSSRVAILPFENHTGDPALDGLGLLAADQVRQVLQVYPKVKVVAGQPLPAGEGNPAQRLARATGARFVGLGSYILKGGQVEFQAQMIDPWKGVIVYTLGPWRGPREDPAKALEDLGQNLAGALVWNCDQVIRLEPGASRAPRLDAYLEYLKAFGYRGTDNNAAMAGFQRAIALDPRFVFTKWNLYYTLMGLERYEAAAALVQDMEADLGQCTQVEQCLVRSCIADLAGRPHEALKAYEDLRAIHPDTPIFRFNRAVYEIQVNRPGRAVQDLTGLPPGWAAFGAPFNDLQGHYLGLAQHRVGAFEDQVRTARQCQAASPDNLEFRVQEAAALAALGRLGPIGTILDVLPTIPPRPGTRSCERCLAMIAEELEAHGHPEASRRLAERFLAEHAAAGPELQKRIRASTLTMLELADRIPEALETARTLAAERPAVAAHQGEQGALLARLGRTEEARRIEAGLASLSGPFLYGEPEYQRARIAARLGEKDRAVALLRQAFGQGYTFEEAIHVDLHLASLHGYPPYEILMKPED